MSKTKNRREDSHHLCFPKRQWDIGYAKTLRNHWYFVVSIPRKQLHRQIHHEILGVPLPRNHCAKEAYEQVEMLEKYGSLHPDDPVEKRLKLLIALFECVEPETAEAFKKQLALCREFYHHSDIKAP